VSASLPVPVPAPEGLERYARGYPGHSQAGTGTAGERLVAGSRGASLGSSGGRPAPRMVERRYS
jgi:hypothetical protein